MGQFLLAEGYGTAGHHQTLPSFILQLGHLASIRLMTNGSLPSQRILCCSVDMEPVPRWMPSGPGPIRTRPRGWWQPIRVWWRRAALSSTGSAAWRPPETTSLEHRPSDGVAGAAPQSPQHSETISKSNVCFYANSFAPWSDSMPIFLAICIVIPVMVYANFYPCPFFLGGGRRFFFHANLDPVYRHLFLLINVMIYGVIELLGWFSNVATRVNFFFENNLYQVMSSIRLQFNYIYIYIYRICWLN